LFGDSGALRRRYNSFEHHIMARKTWGGQRKGAGRPQLEEKRKRRALCFLDEEWELIRQKAAERNMSPREYLYYLVERDN
jgi:hypothetical protein